MPEDELRRRYDDSLMPIQLLLLPLSFPRRVLPVIGDDFLVGGGQPVQARDAHDEAVHP